MNSQEENKLRHISFSIVALRMRRKESSASQPKTDQKLDKVNYSTGDVDLNQNAAYMKQWSTQMKLFTSMQRKMCVHTIIAHLNCTQYLLQISDSKQV